MIRSLRTHVIRNFIYYVRTNESVVRIGNIWLNDRLSCQSSTLYYISDSWVADWIYQ